jgi:hypothetical protein
MALTPIDGTHALQIQAGTLGRKAGHAFEDNISLQIDHFIYPLKIPELVPGHLFTGDPALNLVSYICRKYSIAEVISVKSISTGSLATAEEGKKWLSINGVNISRCKSDLIITFIPKYGSQFTVGVSTKQCNNKTPTNAQLFFTTAHGFSNLLIKNGIPVSDKAILALRQFCGDNGFRPLDLIANIDARKIDHRRFFWEEIDPVGKVEWEIIFTHYQDIISRLLFQKAYLDDPFVPEFLLHKTKAALNWQTAEVAIYTIDEIVSLSCRYGGFSKKEYAVKKGSYQDPAGASKHEAPRFGIIQMQRGGQAQHPEQLQFNLEAGYFYKI